MSAGAAARAERTLGRKGVRLCGDGGSHECRSADPSGLGGLVKRRRGAGTLVPFVPGPLFMGVPNSTLDGKNPAEIHATARRKEAA